MLINICVLLFLFSYIKYRSTIKTLFYVNLIMGITIMKIHTLLLIIFCTALSISCTPTRAVISNIDLAENINNYQPITPILAGKATGAMVASLSKGQQISDDTSRAIIKELCVMDGDFKEYWMRRQWRVNGIDYRRSCDSLDGNILDPMP